MNLNKLSSVIRKLVFTLCLQLQTARLSSEARHTLTTEQVDTVHTHTISTAVPIHTIINVGLTISTSADTGVGINTISTCSSPSAICANTKVLPLTVCTNIGRVTVASEISKSIHTRSSVTACDSIELTVFEKLTTASKVERST